MRGHKPKERKNCTSYSICGTYTKNIGFFYFVHRRAGYFTNYKIKSVSKFKPILVHREEKRGDEGGRRVEEEKDGGRGGGRGRGRRVRKRGKEEQRGKRGKRRKRVEGEGGGTEGRNLLT